MKRSKKETITILNRAILNLGNRISERKIDSTSWNDNIIRLAVIASVRDFITTGYLKYIDTYLD
ncbi:MAG: hypothetical protein EOM62_17480 [Bacteroidia bacterium]|nr:hypothetical protein [Bacteroidia bacterium]